MKTILVLASLLLTLSASAEVACVLSVNGMTKDSVPGYKGTPNRPFDARGFECVPAVTVDGTLSQLFQDSELVAVSAPNEGLKVSASMSRTSSDVVICECASFED